LNVRSPQTLKFAEITALVPFSTATPVIARHPMLCDSSIGSDDGMNNG